MTLPITKQEFQLLRNFIEEQCGITLSEDKMYLVENRLSGLVKEAGCNCFGDLYKKLKNSPESKLLLGAMVDAITTNETLWFRDQYPYQILSEHILPKLHEEIVQQKRSRIEIWSCACSTGQEPYSIAMKILDFYKGLNLEKEYHTRINILASDISQKSLKMAKDGKYDSMAMKRGLSSDDTQRFFVQQNKEWIISDDVKTLITFKECNLKNLRHEIIGPFDIIFLRNVIIYFSDSFKKTLFDHIARLLSPDGYLILGAGETVTGYTEAFEILEHMRAPYYRLKRSR